jgi:protein phosphatase
MSNQDAFWQGEGEQENDLDSTAKFNRDDLVRGWREYEARQPRCLPILKYAAKTDMGQVRENNEDKFDYYEPESGPLLAARGSLFAVADGVGGAQAGQIASELMLKLLISSYYDDPAPQVETALRHAVDTANDRIFSLAKMIPERNGMGTTLTAAVFIEDRVLVAQLGDSRAYLLRDGAIRQVTQDHSWVEDQVRAGILTRQEAEMSPFRNVITRSIGAAPTVQPDIFVEPCRVGDIWVLCSDGLTTYVDEAELARIALRHAPSEVARQLIELANARGGRDNITVFVISVRDLISPAPAGVAATGEATVQNNGFINTASYPALSARQIAFEGAGPVASVNPPPRSGWRRLFGR